MIEADITKEVTQLMPVPTVAMPVVSGSMQHGYDMALAALLAQLLGITAEELVKRTQEASNV